MVEADKCNNLILIALINIRIKTLLLCWLKQKRRMNLLVVMRMKVMLSLLVMMICRFRKIMNKVYTVFFFIKN